MRNYNIRKSFLVDCYALNMNKAKQIDKFINFLDKSGVCELLNEYDKTVNNAKNLGGRPSYNLYDMLALVLYNFAFHKGSIRDIEEKCRSDLNSIYIMQNDYPTHTTISSFINKYIVPNCDKIFSIITKRIYETLNLDMDNIYIDGSKFEANANKYKFVWKPVKFHFNLSEKIRELLNKHNLSKDVPQNENIPSAIVAKKIVEFYNLYKDIDFKSKENKHIKKDYDSLLGYLSKSLEYEEKERICGPNRKSYYKTDKDATAMCLKDDYYSGLGSNMHAAYNVQIGVINGLISMYLVSQSRTDINDFIPLLDKYYLYYNEYPAKACADSGYGSLENYEYLEKHEIRNFVKYFTWQGNVSGTNPSTYIYNKNDNTITCLNGNTGSLINNISRRPKYSNSNFFKIEGCLNCPFSAYCKRYMNKKDDNFKIFEVRPKLQSYIQEAEQNLLSVEGIELRVNRSIQVEGAFGIIKQDLSYTRFRRRSLKKVSAEFMLVCLGFNIKKLFKYFNNESQPKYWKAPKNIEPEKFKKPSAKRLSNKASKKKNKSINQKAKDNYKY